jgi:hypothetical protein
MAPYDDQGGARQKGAYPQIYTKVGFLLLKFGILLIIMPVLIDFLHFWEILGIFGAQILGGSWGWITNFRSI